MTKQMCTHLDCGASHLQSVRSQQAESLPFALPASFINERARKTYLYLTATVGTL